MHSRGIQRRGSGFARTYWGSPNRLVSRALRAASEERLDDNSTREDAEGGDLLHHALAEAHTHDCQRLAACPPNGRIEYRHATAGPGGKGAGNHDPMC